MASQYRRRSLMLNTIAKVAQGNPTIITDSSSRRLQKLNIYGQSSQDGTPSVENPIPIISKEVSEIKVTGKNQANIKEFENVFDGNTFEAHYEDDKITYSGADNWCGCAVVLNQTFKKGQYTIHVKGVVMLLSDIALPSFKYNEYWNGKGYPYVYRFTQSDTKVSFNSDMPFKIGFIGGDINTGSSTVSGTIEQCQIELSSEATFYEPYKSQTITPSEPITLRGITVESGGNVTIDGQQYVSDVICEKDGVIGTLRNIIRPTLKENLTFTQTADQPNRTANFLAFAESNLKNGDCESLSSHFVWKKWGNNTVGRIGLVFAISGQILYISPPRKADGDYTKEEIETLVNGKWAEIKDDVEFYGQLQEPTFEPLPEEIQEQYKALKSYYPNTVIQTGCWNEVTYSAKSGRLI